MLHLTEEELQRYRRHLVLPQVGIEGQERLKNAKVLIVGAGGLGSPCLLYLAAAGVGTIGIVDFDCVDFSNLQRQVVYAETDVSKSKVKQAAERVNQLNSCVSIKTHNTKLNADNVCALVEQYDLVIDGTDNFTARYLVNDACVLLGKPNVYGSIYQFEGQVSLFESPDGPCFRCLFEEPPDPDSIRNCAEGGVLGVIAGVIGTLQATEAIKWILGIGEPLKGRVLLYDALSSRFDTLTLQRREACPVCGANPSITEIKALNASCSLSLKPSAEEQHGTKGLQHSTDSTFEAMSQNESRIRTQTDIQMNERNQEHIDSQTQTATSISQAEFKALVANEVPHLLLDVRSEQEFNLSNIPNAFLIPLDELDGRINELPKNEEIVVYCKSGLRSERAARLLRDFGFERVRSLDGGIDRFFYLMRTEESSA